MTNVHTSAPDPMSAQNGSVSSGTKKGVSGSTIKLIAIAAMLIDHTAAVILARIMMRAGYLLAVSGLEDFSSWTAEHRLLYYSFIAMRLIGRFGFPIFCFLLVEGFLHTRNRVKYALRLLLFAFVSEIPFDLAFNGKWFDMSYQNVFFTLFLGLLAMCAFSFFNERLTRRNGGVLAGVCLAAGIFCIGAYGALAAEDVVYTVLDSLLPGVVTLSSTLSLILLGSIIAMITAFVLFLSAKKHGLVHAQIIGADLTALCLTAFAADLLMTDYAGMGVITIALMYAFRKSHVKSMLAGCISLTIMEISEAAAFLMLIPISRYNGRRGINLKYVFYAFYPVHLAILYLISVAMGLK